jgi:hypothetical protein
MVRSSSSEMLVRIKSLKFPVNSGSHDGNWTRIAVKRRIDDKLIIHCGVHSLPDFFEMLLGFQNFLELMQRSSWHLMRLRVASPAKSS